MKPINPFQIFISRNLKKKMCGPINLHYFIMFSRKKNACFHTHNHQARENTVALILCRESYFFASLKTVECNARPKDTLGLRNKWSRSTDLHCFDWPVNRYCPTERDLEKEKGSRSHFLSLLSVADLHASWHCGIVQMAHPIHTEFFFAQRWLICIVEDSLPEGYQQL